VVSKAKIEEVAHAFMEKYGNIDLQHTLNNVGKVVESFVLPFDWQVSKGVKVPAGSWMMGVKVTDEKTWQSIKDGKLTGFSIMGISKAALKEAGAEKAQAEKRTTLADLGDDWIVNAVSLVDQPAVPKAKWISIKSAEETTEEPVKKMAEPAAVTAVTVQKAIEGSLEARSDLVRRKVWETFSALGKDVYVHSTMDKSVIFEIWDTVNHKGSKMCEVDYTIEKNGTVTFGNDVRDVQIKQTVVPVVKGAQDTGTGTNSSENAAKVQNDLETNQEANKGFFARIKELFGIKPADKSGRKISEANFQKLKAAQEVIAELLGVAETERAHKEEENDMDKQEVEKMIADSMKPLNDQLQEVFRTLKGETKQGAEEKPAAEKAGEKKEETTEKAADKGKEESADKAGEKGAEKSTEEEDEEVAKALLEQLTSAQAKKTLSKRITGQDETPKAAEKAEEEDRDEFGYKIIRK
jgi:hypothetical protein